MKLDAIEIYINRPIIVQTTAHEHTFQYGILKKLDQHNNCITLRKAVIGASDAGYHMDYEEGVRKLFSHIKKSHATTIIPLENIISASELKIKKSVEKHKR